MQFMFHGKPHSGSFVHGSSPLFPGCLKYLNCQIKFQIFNCSYRPLQCNRVIDFDVNAIGSSSNTIKCSISHPCGSETREELSREGYNNLICELCRVGDADEAMALLAQMEALGFRPNAVSYTFLITALGNVGRTLEADAIFQDMIRLGFKPGRKVYNVLLRGFLKKGLLRLADKVLVAIDDLGIRRNQETYEILLDYYVHAGRLPDTWSVIGEMKQEGLQLNSFVYSKVIGLYRDNGMWKKAMGIVREIKEMGVPLDKRIYNSIINTFGKYGELGEALEVFEKMQQEGIKPDITTWNSLIKWHCKFGDVANALELFAKMLEQGVYPDPKIFITIISRLGEQGNWDMMKKNFENMKCRGHKKSGVIYAVLVDIYGQYGRFLDAEECINALKLEGIQLSASVFSVLANAYAQQGLCEQTVKVLQLMEVAGIEPNLVMLNVLINAFGISGRLSEALSGVSPDVVTYSTLMKAFMRAKKFDQIPVIYKEMESAGCTPDRRAREMLQNAIMVLEQRHLYTSNTRNHHDFWDSNHIAEAVRLNNNWKQENKAEVFECATSMLSPSVMLQVTKLRLVPREDADARLTKAYQTAAVLFEVLKAVNLTESLEVADEIQVSVSALQNTRGLPWPKGHKKKVDEDILDWLQAMFGFRKDNVLDDTALTESLDKRVWALHSSGIFSCKSFFDYIIDNPQIPQFPFCKKVWKACVPLKVKVFMWALIHGGILTNDTLQKRRPNRLLNPQWCILCCKSGESVDHLFLHCPIALTLWHRLFRVGNGMWVAPKRSVHMLVIDFHTFGGSKRAKILWTCVVFATFWVLWWERNQRLFEDKFREVQCGDVEFEKKIDEKIGQFTDRVEKHPSKKIDEKIGQF
ncbi:unnamed protein product [Camellia sinensis]